MRLNWGAIVLAGVADWILGAVWFTAFKTPWQEGTRIPKEELQVYMAHPNYWPYVISLVCSIAIAYVIARVLSAWAYTLIHGMGIGILIGLAAALAMITEMVFELRAIPFMMISAAYPLLGCILMGAVVGGWKPKRIPT